MPDIQITDNLGAPVPGVKIDLSQPSSLVNYAKAEVLHLAVVPDFVARAPLALTAAAPTPITFQLHVGNDFQLGGQPEIDLTPSAGATIRANTTAGSNLFAHDVFLLPSLIPAGTGYVSLAFQGSLDLGVFGSAGDLTFGFDASGAVGLEYWKAFPLGAAEPTLGQATGAALSGFVIPAGLKDLDSLALNDICAVSGQGSLTVAGGFSVSAVPNPLALVDLPLNAGSLRVQTGAIAGITASYTITGSYQLRIRRISKDTVEFSVCKKQGAQLKTDLSASAGVKVTMGRTDLLKALLGAISANPADDATQKLFADGGLSPDEIARLTGAIKDGLDHSLQASLDLALCQLSEGQAAFQYEVSPASLDADGSEAVGRALKGDLSGLTALESAAGGAALAPGIRLISSVLTTARTKKATLKLNLLGLVNYISVTELIRKCVVVKDPGTGDLTIADSATGNRINAEVQDFRRGEALRKAMFDSLMLTATYRVSKTVTMTGITSHAFHFAFNQNTRSAILKDYLNWFVLMNLIAKPEADQIAGQFPGGGASTCLLRAEFDDDACRSLFFQSPGVPWPIDRYLETGRRAMRGLIDPNNNDVDRARCLLLDQHWADAVKIGPNNNLAPLVGLHLTDPTGMLIVQSLIGDVYTISWWATAMVTAAAAILDMQKFLGDADPATMPDSQEFADRRSDLQKKMASAISKSRTRFDEPWGLVSLFWAAGSTGASARLSATGLVLERPV